MSYHVAHVSYPVTQEWRRTGILVCYSSLSTHFPYFPILYYSFFMLLFLVPSILLPYILLLRVPNARLSLRLPLLAYSVRRAKVENVQELI